MGSTRTGARTARVFTSESRVIRLALGGQDHFISVQQDITERKRAESLLQAQRDLAMSSQSDQRSAGGSEAPAGNRHADRRG